ncbi:hypothetical protein, partial [Mesorhizobium sp. M00.F.Ca.ET.216.01.1.1]|uniref:hypothetical protein n=1 Tax=Mesorhizobium sp. M00.F.Ca.ET.216.01.1.1 TaxID=2500528 RepID=UPI0010938919
QAPRQAAADGGYASRENLRRAKAWGVRDMAFHKKSGLKVEDMCGAAIRMRFSVNQDETRRGWCDAVRA